MHVCTRVRMHGRISMHLVGRLTPFPVYVRTHPSKSTLCSRVSTYEYGCLLTQYAESRVYVAGVHIAGRR